MTQATPSAAPPKKRSLFKRPAWQDSPKDDDADIFSHSNEFADIIADEARRRAEEKKQEETRRTRKHSQPRDSKRRRTSNPDDKKATASSTLKTSPKRNKTPLSPLPVQSPPASLAARYDSLATSNSSAVSLPHKDSLVIELGDSEDDSHNVHKSPAPVAASHTQNVAVRRSKPSPVVILDDDDEDEAEDEEDSMFAALRARARARIAAKAAASSAQGSDAPKAPITQLLITSRIPNTNPLMVKIRVDTFIEKPRKACTSITRLGITVDENGHVTIEGDTNIYDDVNLPKIHVEAWTNELYKEYKKEEAAAAAAKMLAAEAPVVVEERTPTPEPTPVSTKLRVILRAKGRADFGLTVNPHTTIAHIASAYKSQTGIDKSQPITLMFDGDRLMPMDTVADYEMEDRDGIEVLFK
ncbi:ubiquitin-2 like Rad60 SUMO-like-domain-containing protein [Bipolaris maydis]|nr:ubiquitin-2 like Rad60 SUMO-like-domain-containing protein [Bipolaris maydis]KAJ6277112.1 ubiquitin-2 like Rad60 SUMO-like-domain-containing protein [Bipolaris maydis]